MYLFFKNFFLWLRWVLGAAHGSALRHERSFTVALHSVLVVLRLSYSAARGILSLLRNWTRLPCVARLILNHRITREVPASVFLKYILLLLNHFSRVRLCATP